MLGETRQNRVYDLLAAIGLAGLSLLFLGDFLRPPAGQYLGGWDVTTQLLPWLRLARAELAAGRLPLWNPYLASGMPMWANPQPGWLYPPNWILLVAPWNTGISWLKAFHVFWTGLGMYVWARGQKLGPGGALVGALTFSYCGLMAVRVADGHPNFSAAIAWLPWVMAALERSFRRGTLGSAAVAGLPLAMAVYAGNPAGGFLTGGLAGLWTLAEMLWPPATARTARQRWLFPPRQLLLAGLVAAGLSAAQLLPTLELITRSVRTSEQGYAFASQFSLPAAHLITLIVPNFFGEPVRLGYWGEFGQLEYVLYPGMLALLLAAVAARYGRDERRVRLWLALAVLGLLLALGPAGGLHPLLYNALPVMGLVRVPARLALWSLFAVAGLAAWAVDHLEKNPALPLHAASGAGRFGSPTGLALLAGVPAALSVLAFLFYTLSPREDARAYHIGAGLLLAALFLGLGGGLLRWQPRLPARIFAGLALALTLADLWGYGRQELRFTAEGQDDTWQQAAAVIGAAGPELSVAVPSRVLPWGMGIFQQNLVMDVGLASALSYDPLMLGDYQTFIDSVPDPRATTFDLLSAEYLLIPSDQAEWRGEPGLSYLGEAGIFAVYRRLAALPRAWIVPRARQVAGLEAAIAAIHSPGFDPRAEALTIGETGCPPGGGGSARIEAYAPGSLRVAAEGSGIVILSETWYPGWQASVDGRPAPVLKVDGVLRGVCLPEAGRHTIELRFEPPLLRWGLVVTSITGLAGLALAIRYLFTRIPSILRREASR